MYKSQLEDTLPVRRRSDVLEIPCLANTDQIKTFIKISRQ